MEPVRSFRPFRVAIPVLAAGLLLTASPVAAQSSSPTADTSPAASTAAAAPGFPLTVEHKYGSTTLGSVPQRIVTVGLLEQDPLLALGVPPVAVTEWFGGHPSAAWPWAQPLLGGAAPEVIGDATTVDPERIAAADPDLILALYSGLTEEQYDQLSGIAPTIAQPADYVDYGIPWQELTTTIGAIVGKPAQAEALVADVESRFAEVAAAHPEFQGATAVVATPWEGIFVYGPEDVRGRLLTSLGFQLPEGLAEATGATWGGHLSEEAADLLDTDVIIWLDSAGADDLGGPIYDSLAVHTEGREVLLDSVGDPLGGATSFVTVLSIPFLLDGLVPMLAAAIDGDPATVVPPSGE